MMKANSKNQTQKNVSVPQVKAQLPPQPKKKVAPPPPEKPKSILDQISEVQEELQKEKEKTEVESEP